MHVSEQTLHDGRVGTRRWVLTGGLVGRWVRRIFAPTPLTTNIYLLNVRQRTNLARQANTMVHMNADHTTHDKRLFHC